jgi:hypothetical protein
MCGDAQLRYREIEGGWAYMKLTLETDREEVARIAKRTGLRPEDV